MDQWTILVVLRQAIELSLGKGWVEWDPWAVCLFYKSPGSIMLFYLSLCKKITGMKVDMISFTNIT